MDALIQTDLSARCASPAYNAVAAPATAVKDGTVYLYNLPYGPHAFAVAGGLGVLYGTHKVYRAINPSEEEQLKEKNRIAELNAQARVFAETASTNTTADEFRTCLNTHARCGDRNENNLPRRCNSPARRLAQLNRHKADEIASAFRAYQ